MKRHFSTLKQIPKRKATDYFAEGVDHSTKRRRGTADLTREDEMCNATELEDDDEDTPPIPSIEDVEDEENELLELEEITRQEFEHHAYHRSATEVEPNHELVDIAPNYGDGDFKIGDSVELKDGDFLRIKFIIRNKSLSRDDHEAYTLRGILLRRQRRMERMFKKQTNELVAIILVPLEDQRPHFIAGLQDRALSLVTRVRAVIFTNTLYPRFSFRDPEVLPDWYKFYSTVIDRKGNAQECLDAERAAAEGPLVVRWKSVKYYTRKGRSEIKLERNAFRRLTQHESDPKHGVPDALLFKEYRNTLGGGQASRSGPHEPLNRRLSRLSVTPGPSRTAITIEDDSDDDVVDVTHLMQEKRNTTNDPPALERSLQRWSPLSGRDQATRESRTNARPLIENPYTLMDLFCASGGISEGARQAGLKPVFGVDLKPCAVKQYQLNHPGTLPSHPMNVSEFLTGHKAGEIDADVCHCSCPCQFWSFQHTCEGKNDDANIAASFLLDEARKKSRCRLMTFEQTAGFCALAKHLPFWQMFINQFTSAGFDVEWRILNLADYGNPQARKRLIIFAACPGQKIPDYPEPTHGQGLRPYVTVNEAIKDISPFASMHNPEVLRRGHSKRPAANGDAPLRRLIDTTGPKESHPTGRPFTVRETLRLQGFPDHYEYDCQSRTEAMTMIGDAVPPVFGKHMFKKCIEALKYTDAEIREFDKPIILD